MAVLLTKPSSIVLILFFFQLVGVVLLHHRTTEPSAPSSSSSSSSSTCNNNNLWKQLPVFQQQRKLPSIQDRRIDEILRITLDPSESCQNVTTTTCTPDWLSKVPPQFPQCFISEGGILHQGAAMYDPVTSTSQQFHDSHRHSILPTCRTLWISSFHDTSQDCHSTYNSYRHDYAAALGSAL
jgi:hypothetical protein